MHIGVIYFSSDRGSSLPLSRVQLSHSQLAFRPPQSRDYNLVSLELECEVKAWLFFVPFFYVAHERV
jgi:hypothetical protein